MSTVTLREVAEISGVSIATVSRVLNGDEGVRGPTRERVMEAAQRLGFRRNRAAMRLKTGRTRVVGFVLNRDEPADSFARQILLGLADGLAGQEYHVVVQPEGAGAGVESVQYLGDPQVADGVVMTHTQSKDRRARWLMDQRRPFITHGQTGLDHDWVDFDNRQFAVLANHYFVGRDRRAAALIPPPRRFAYANEMIAGFDQACGALNRRVLDIDWSADPRAVYQAVAAVAGDVDSWLLPDEGLLMPAMAALRDAGRVVGVDCDVAVKRFTDLVDYAGVPLWCADESLYSAGRAMAELLVKRIEQPDRPAVSHLITPKFSMKGGHYGV
ncbi:LacI family DNA-binding transcriptional regulator [Litorivicinus lipolyticus]|uniref:LacI family DNA-binding transcriptional regulator n=1 Tax=Litorivicinus lipolyticus TaxID=418701 RepID=UPI003B59D7EF